MAERRRLVAVALLTGGILAASALAAHAQSSLGIGAAEPVIAPDPGPFAALLAWINQQQQDFYKLLTGALRDMRDNPSAGFLLAGLSFAYGIFHAAGPGHGKAVISSYMLANEVALRRGVMLSFISAFLQALTAIVVIGAIFLFLRGTAVNQTNAVWTLEVMSYALVTGFGFWLLVRKFLRMRRERTARPHALSAAIVEPAPVHAHEHGHEHSHDCGCGHDHDHHRHDHHDHGHGHVRHHHAAGEVCDECGHAHMPDPAQLSGDRFRWSDAWSAVIAVGLRPCSGALIVLTFAWLNGMVWGGIASVFAMALGTAITVSAMATLAVTAKNAAMRLAGDGAAGMAVHNAIEIAGAATVFVLGLLLLFASLAA